MKLVPSVLGEKLKYIHIVTDRGGRRRFYFRRGRERHPLPSAPGSLEFMSTYVALLAKSASNKSLRKRRKVVALASRRRGRPPSSEAPRPGVPSSLPSKPVDAPNTERPIRTEFLPGSIGWVITQFIQSRKWKSYRPGTQKNYRLLLDAMRGFEEAVGGTTVRFGACMMRDLNRRNVSIYCGKIDERHGGSTADAHLKLISLLWKFSLRLPECAIDDSSANPTRDIDRHSKIVKPHAPWPDLVLQRFYASASPSLRLAMMMLLYTGQRRIDVIKMKWTDYDGRCIPVIQEKTGAELVISVHRDLKKILDATPRVHEKILTHKWRRPYTPDSLTHRIKDVLIAIGAPGYTLHGLRKNAGVMLAEAGCSVSQIMAVLGHTSPKMALYYCNMVNQKKLNADAMTAWENTPVVVVDADAAPDDVQPAARKAKRVRRVA